jgi:hypothetical protein
MSFVALFKGLFYCEKATDQATELMHRFCASGDRSQRFAAACRDGLQGHVGDRRLLRWAEELVELADAALERCAPEDRRWLLPLIHQLDRGESPARTLLGQWQPGQDVSSLLDLTSMRATEKPSDAPSSHDRALARGLKMARLAERLVALTRRARGDLQRRDPTRINDEIRQARRQLKKLRRLMQAVQEDALANGIDHISYARLRVILRPLEARLDGKNALRSAKQTHDFVRSSRHAIRDIVGSKD